MTPRCLSCGAAGAGSVCPVCDGEPRVSSRFTDPLIGGTIADRYEILSLVGVGGMGRVYRALQRSLDREVAVKVIHPHLTGSQMLVQRFMTEALAASRLNHPHIVSIFDFGHEAEGGNLYLVMELLAGVNLASVMQSDGALPFPRIVTILGQTLEALAVAHDVGITHRDMKPDNIILTPRRGGGDHVKVIDFGIAKLGADGRITENGQVCGTPAYMAPEQGAGRTMDPRADLYSVGVVMFEMLTGKLPFDGPTPATMMLRHMTETRPDPRKVAPQRGIPDALAAACLKALEIEPDRRFSSAEEFQQALARGLRASLLPGAFAPVSRFDPSDWMLEETVPAMSALGVETLVAPLGVEESALIGRAADVAWARELLERREAPQAMALLGRSGLGRTRLVEDITTMCARAGTSIVPIPLRQGPRSEVGYQALRTMILRLSGLTAEALLQGDVPGVTDRWAWTGFRAVFRQAPGRLPADPSALRRGAAAALTWAARRATERAEGGRALMVIDDVEHLDRASWLALDDLLRGAPIPRFTVLVTGERSPGGALEGAETRELRGLTRAEAEQMLARLGEPVTLTRSDDDIEPLYVDQLCRLDPSEQEGAPATLLDIVAWRVQGLLPAHRRFLLAVAVTGGGPLDRLALLLRRPNEADEALQPLIDGGFVRVSDGEVVVTHSMLARAAIAAAPAGAVSEMHEAAAEALSVHREQVELRAFHAIRGRADFEAFLMLEEAARTRTARGDDQGAIAALWTAVHTARSQMARGEVETASTALSVFGRKLATALANDGSLDMAKAVLDEVIDATSPTDASRSLLLEQAAALAQLRGDPEEALQRRREALRLAERSGDTNVAERLRAFVAASGSAPGSENGRESEVPGQGRPSMPSARPRNPPVLIVDDDRAIREGLKSVVESAGHQAFVAGNGREAIDLLRKIPRPALILLDLMMPVMTGWELLARLREDEAYSAIPVVIVSAVPSKDAVGAARVVQKPLDVDVLLNIVEEFCG
ncbi:protein kinase domain-containing protein [Polyangium aurulentum]|uniref:protein kinase domain-containing protein n=1 Tax=Polyangium aurulentum TaxID=2567896 RepID=UPI00146D607F|nr:protein kinase [Polyangium aurulentum]UQA59706.1 protein kinase [Polyangium aurulentum]